MLSGIKRDLFSNQVSSSTGKSFAIGTLVAVIHKNFMESKQHILSFYSLTAGVHGRNYSVSKVSLRWYLETRLSCVHLHN